MIFTATEKLEEMLDREVGEYLFKVEGIDEVKALLSGEISREDYARFLKTFYIIEYISRKAVLSQPSTRGDGPPPTS